MKVFYSVSLVLIFLLHGDAKSSSFAAPLHFISFNGKPDSLNGSTGLSVKAISDSLFSVCKEIAPVVITKPLTGLASFYCKSLEGCKTATGEIFHHAYLTAASNNFPLNTWLRVTNLKNSKSVIVRINDRMHPKMAKKGRVVDLTTAAAKEIGLSSRSGIAKVSVEVVDEESATN